MRAPTVSLVFVVVSALCACGDEADPRFASPESTIETLLTAYGVADMSQEEIQAHMRTRQGFELRDEAAYRACFVDYRGPEDEGMAGYVFGTVAAGKDQLRIVRTDDEVRVYPNPERVDRYVLLVQEEANWKIDLRRSVPEDVQRSLLETYQRIDERNRRAGGG